MVPWVAARRAFVPAAVAGAGVATDIVPRLEIAARVVASAEGSYVVAGTQYSSTLVLALE